MSTRHVLAVLDNDEGRLWATFELAVQIADAERARLTLAKTTNPGLALRWFAPAALQTMVVTAADLDFETLAGHTLARAAEFVPASIPVTTTVLRRNTTGALLELLRRGCYDVLVAPDSLLAHSRRLRRELARLGVRPAPVPRRAAPPARGRALRDPLLGRQAGPDRSGEQNEKTGASS